MSLRSRLISKLVSWPILSLVLAAFVAFGTAVSAEDFVQPEPLKPEIAAASGEAAEGLSGIKIPAGWEISLFAAEPDVANVVAFDIDNRGRFFVCETFRQNRGVTDNRGHDDQWLLADLAAQTVQDRINYHKKLLGEAAVTYAQHDDRVRRLVDTDGDGKADESTVLADGFNRIEEGTGAGVLARGDDVYFTCIPKLWKLVDSDDDGKADDRVVMSDGYGVRVAFRGHDMHGLILGPDGRLYFSIGDRGYHVTTPEGQLLANPAVGAVFRCELDGSGLEVFCNGLRNPQEIAFNQYGDFFTVDNNSDSGDQARIVQLLEGGDTGWRMYYQYLPDRGPFNREKIWEPFHNEQPAYINPPIANFTDGPSGMAYYPGTGFGDQLKDQFLICDFRGGPSNSGIRSFALEAAGAFHKLAADDQPIWTTLATDAKFGPDGAIYISDWVDGWNGLGKGRIYRLADPEHIDSDIVKEVKTLLASDWSSHESTRLAELLAHADQRVRLEAQWSLANRRDFRSLLQVASNTDAAAVTRLHGIWGADQIARQGGKMRESVLEGIRPLLRDADAYVRAAAVKVVGERGDQVSVKQVREMIGDESARVKYFAAISLGKLKDPAAMKPVVSMLAANDNADPALRHAGVMYLTGAASAPSIAALKTHPSEALRRAAVVALRRLRSELIVDFLTDSSLLVRQEVARAIHDAPIPVALDDLAGVISTDLMDEAIAFRVLNANYRIGTAETASALGRYASVESNPEAMRLKALEMLKAWGAPDPRDLVINDYRPIEARDSEVAADVIRPLVDRLMNAQPSVREMAIDVASSLGVVEIAPMLISRVADTKQDGANRARALEALQRLDSAAAVKAANAVPAQPAGPLLVSALNVLAKDAREASVDKFVQATSSTNVAVRQLGWDILGDVDASQSEKLLGEAVDSFLAGELAGDVQLNVIEAAQKRLAPDLVAKVTDAQAEAAKSDPLAPWLVALKGGNVKQGEKVFMEKTQLSCVRCHKVDRAGGEVGPELTLIGRTKDRRYLLEAICLPDAQIAKGFETAVIVDLDGQIVTGIVKSEDDDEVVLIQADGSQVRVLQDDIELRKKGKSSMPGDLTSFMTKRELRDLVAYLAQLKYDRHEDEVE